MLRNGPAVPVLAALLALPALADEAEDARFIRIPGTGTRLKFDGFIQVYGSYFHDQNLYDNGALIGGEDVDPLNAAATPDRQFSLTARTTQFGLTTVTPSAYLGDVTTRIEMDFARGVGFVGAPHLRQAYVSFGNWVLGHTWSNWLDQDAGASTVDASGPVGQACNDTGRYTQVRYTFPLSKWSSLALSLEKNTLSQKSKFPDNDNPANPATAVPDARYPTLVAAYTYTDDWGHLAIRGLEQHYGAYNPATASANPSTRCNRWAGAVQLSGGLKLGRDSLVGSWYTGQALGSYGIGIQAANYNLATGQVGLTRNSGWQAGYTHAWNDRLRSNLVASGLHFQGDSAGPNSIKNAHNYFVNTMVQLTRSVELGLEYGYENLKTFGAQAVTRKDGTKSDRNHSNKLQLCLTAKF